MKDNRGLFAISWFFPKLNNVPILWKATILRNFVQYQHGFLVIWWVWVNGENGGTCLPVGGHKWYCAGRTWTQSAEYSQRTHIRNTTSNTMVKHGVNWTILSLSEWKLCAGMLLAECARCKMVNVSSWPMGWNSTNTENCVISGGNKVGRFNKNAQVAVNPFLKAILIKISSTENCVCRLSDEWKWCGNPELNFYSPEALCVYFKICDGRCHYPHPLPPTSRPALQALSPNSRGKTVCYWKSQWLGPIFKKASN